jgi:hypothetical protein
VRGDYYGVALLPFGLDASPQTGQAVFIVGFVEDKTPEVHQAKVFEGGDHAYERVRSLQWFSHRVSVEEPCCPLKQHRGSPGQP